jgi:hypothetical protein
MAVLVEGQSRTLRHSFWTERGNMFDGFTPVEWDSTSWYKRHDSVQSFLFTLRSPHGLPPRRFGLKGGYSSIEMSQSLFR